jgi:hypothetical protein
MANRKELQVIIKVARTYGWSIDLTKNNHYKWISPSGAFFYSSSTPSDRRALERLKQDLRRLGFDIRKLDK